MTNQNNRLPCAAEVGFTEDRGEAGQLKKSFRRLPQRPESHKQQTRRWATPPLPGDKITPMERSNLKKLRTCGSGSS